MERQVKEAQLISDTPVEHLLNSRSEWGSNSIPRVVIQDQEGTTTTTKGGTKRIPDNMTPLDSRPGDRQGAKRRRTGGIQDCKHEQDTLPQISSNRIQKSMTSFLQIPTPGASGSVFRRRKRVMQIDENVLESGKGLNNKEVL